MELRQQQRRRVLKGATIISNNQSELSCLIRNQSADGAELKISPEMQVPSAFRLYVPTDGVAYNCELIWRRGERAGVRLMGAGPKPRFHYG